MKFAFIPCTVLSEWLNVFPSEAMNAVRKDMGAVSVEYHKRCVNDNHVFEINGPIPPVRRCECCDYNGESIAEYSHVVVDFGERSSLYRDDLDQKKVKEMASPFAITGWWCLG